MIANFTDHAANERTFLSWVRTAIAIVGFGLGAARLGPGSQPFWSEAALLGTGALVVGLAFVRMRRVRVRIEAADRVDDDTVPADGLLLFLVASLFGLLAMFATHVG